MFSYIMGIIAGAFGLYAIQNWIKVYKQHKELQKNKKLNQATNDLINEIQQMNKQMQSEMVNIDFNKRKYEIAYTNKVERIKTKIDVIKYSTLPEQLTKALTSAIIVSIAECEVENDRITGKLDELYSEIN